jgi:hypothetical protein
MKTLGGDDPPIFNESISGFTFFLEWNFTTTGQRDFPQSSFVPLHKAHKLGDSCGSGFKSCFWLRLKDCNV